MTTDGRAYLFSILEPGPGIDSLITQEWNTSLFNKSGVVDSYLLYLIHCWSSRVSAGLLPSIAENRAVAIPADEIVSDSVSEGRTVSTLEYESRLFLSQMSYSPGWRSCLSSINLTILFVGKWLHSYFLSSLSQNLTRWPLAGGGSYWITESKEEISLASLNRRPIQQDEGLTEARKSRLLTIKRRSLSRRRPNIALFEIVIQVRLKPKKRDETRLLTK